MKRANCATVFVGLESVNEETLELYHKHSTLEKNRQAIAAFNAAGIRVHGMFVLGSDADTTQTIADTLKFARQTRLSTAQFFALTALPGPPLTRRLAEEKRIIAWGEWQLFDALHAVVCASRISPYDLQEGINRISKEFYSVSEAFRQLLHGPSRWFNFAIRLQGKLLARRIERDTKAHVQALAAFERVRTQVSAELDRLVAQAQARLHGLGAGIEDRQTRAKAYLRELSGQLDATYARLHLELVPFGHALREMAGKLLEQHFQSLLNKPVPPAAAS